MRVCIVAQPTIMAHRHRWREISPAAVMACVDTFRRCMAWIRRHVPGSCPLCAQRTMAGELCRYCQASVLASMTTQVPRCLRCCLSLDSQGHCADCRRQRFAFDRVTAVFDYAHPGDLLVRRYKEEHRFGLAPMLAGMMSDALDRAVLSEGAPDIVVPVPGHARALRDRGFSPAAELAVHLSFVRGLPIDYRLLLRRDHWAVAQKTLGREARARQAGSLYHCSRSVRGLHVMVVDDVVTTGSTLHAVAKALKAAGANRVSAVVLARTPDHRSSGR